MKPRHALMFYQILSTRFLKLKEALLSITIGKPSVSCPTPLSLSPPESPEAGGRKRYTLESHSNVASSVNSWLRHPGEFWHGEIFQSNRLACWMKPSDSCFQDKKKKVSHWACQRVVINHLLFILWRVLVGVWGYRYESWMRESLVSCMSISQVETWLR